ncbi:hypothetical protein R3P38DRAFT_3360943 [Favolaschia claudopus]|uniref:Uncharacterized protein n=1 Tax=Favolaschia claudopus TaxID=2862362 RepID=A0AAW0AUH9_9AGAR
MWGETAFRDRYSRGVRWEESVWQTVSVSYWQGSAASGLCARGKAGNRKRGRRRNSTQALKKWDIEGGQKKSARDEGGRRRRRNRDMSNVASRYLAPLLSLCSDEPESTYADCEAEADCDCDWDADADAELYINEISITHEEGGADEEEGGAEEEEGGAEEEEGGAEEDEGGADEEESGGWEEEDGDVDEAEEEAEEEADWDGSPSNTFSLSDAIPATSTPAATSTPFFMLISVGYATVFFGKRGRVLGVVDHNERRRREEEEELDMDGGVLNERVELGGSSGESNESETTRDNPASLVGAGNGGIRTVKSGGGDGDDDDKLRSLEKEEG